MSHVRVLQAHDSHLEDLITAFGKRHYFVRQLERQCAGHGKLLVAWTDFTTPAGAVYLWLAPAQEPELRAGLVGVPLLTDLEVRPAFRRQGIATRLVKEAESLAAARSHRLALGVSPDKSELHRFWRNRDYQPWRLWLETTRDIFQDDGTVDREIDYCHVLVKNLVSQPLEGVL
ncbi:GNAT family N-acetyltransferase [Nonomuraea soli]|uniref:GNAT superfamily N-acetyltransferase n=1 Tax=Nonomuraea soli TaxID=1032476 RepID=A0A7W0HPX2_9ACTN|nr:GNAT family N-acetyltransferase [Nonomuraea soli]MBA2891026.1 GNAT superfamily N-acetyltransferase [Nonomuraea soli]